MLFPKIEPKFQDLDLEKMFKKANDSVVDRSKMKFVWRFVVFLMKIYRTTRD